MFVCVCSVVRLSCVWVATLRRADPLSKESYRLCMGLGNRKRGQGPPLQRAVEPNIEEDGRDFNE
jgi:hypothetical protein